MELWEINMNHVSKMVIFFIYTCNFHTIIIDIYLIEDKKKSKVLLKMYMYKCTMYSLLTEWLSTSLKRISRKQKKKKDSVYARFYLRLFALIRRYQWNSTFWNAHLTVNVFFFVILNIAHDAFLSIVIPLFCVQKSIAALCCHTALKLGVNEVVKINCIFRALLVFLFNFKTTYYETRMLQLNLFYGDLIKFKVYRLFLQSVNAIYM